MATSSIPTLKANLQTLLSARASLANVQISYGRPLPSPAREWIGLGDVDGDQEWMAAAKTRMENYQLELIVSTTMEGTDQEPVTERSFALLAEVENAVRTDPTVSGAVITAQIGGSLRLNELPKPDGSARTAEIVTNLVCKNQI